MDSSALARVFCNSVNFGSTGSGGNKVFSLDGNSGIAAFTINGPRLAITKVGSNAVISWPLFSGFTLQATPSISPPVTWTNVGTGTIVAGQYVVTNALDSASFFRLIKQHRDLTTRCPESRGRRTTGLSCLLVRWTTRKGRKPIGSKRITQTATESPAAERVFYRLQKA
jgi:hypothetical protein